MSDAQVHEKGCGAGCTEARPPAEALALFWIEWLGQKDFSTEDRERKGGVRKCTTEGPAKTWVINVSNFTFAQLIGKPRLLPELRGGRRAAADEPSDKDGDRDANEEVDADAISLGNNCALLVDSEEREYMASQSGDDSEWSVGEKDTASSSGGYGVVSDLAQYEQGYRTPYAGRSTDKIAFEEVEAYFATKTSKGCLEKGTIKGQPVHNYWDSWVKGKLEVPCREELSVELLASGLRNKCLDLHRLLHSAILGKGKTSCLFTVAKNSFPHTKTSVVLMRDPKSDFQSLEEGVAKHRADVQQIVQVLKDIWNGTSSSDTYSVNEKVVLMGWAADVSLNMDDSSLLAPYLEGEVDTYRLAQACVARFVRKLPMWGKLSTEEKKLSIKSVYKQGKDGLYPRIRELYADDPACPQEFLADLDRDARLGGRNR